ncbi:MAG: hypothetical protein JWM11_3962 [Planctomycetaceae bacterium]|nr:hypothetical protein [Planctomycetaceae bacterium]
MLAILLMLSTSLTGESLPNRAAVLENLTAQLRSRAFEQCSTARNELVQLAHIDPHLLEPFECVTVALEHPSPDIVASGLTLVGLMQAKGIPTKGFSGSLEQLLSHRIQSQVRYRVYRCLANGPQWSDRLLELLQTDMASKVQFERIYAAAVYWRCGRRSDETVQILLEKLTEQSVDQNHQVLRVWAAHACEMAHVDDPRVIEKLREMAKSVRGAEAVRGLYALAVLSPDDPVIASQLVKLLADHGEEIPVFPREISDMTLVQVCEIAVDVLPRIGKSCKNYESQLSQLIVGQDDSAAITAIRTVNLLDFPLPQKLKLVRGALFHSDKYVRDEARKTFVEMRSNNSN